MQQRRPRVAVTGPWDLPGWDDAFVAAGYEVRSGPSIDESPSTPLSEAQLRDLCAKADAILISSRERLTASVLEVAPELRVIAKATIGVERIDVRAATSRGILVVNSPAPENIIGVAEATVGLIVSVAKRLLAKERHIRSGDWRDASTDGMLLAGSTIGIVGLGRVGGAVARRLQGWDCEVIAYDPYVAPSRFAECGVRSSQLGPLLDAADVVTFHVPLTEETRSFIGAPELSRLRTGAVVVNTSRGEVIDEAALTTELGNDRLYAALDVFATEPLPARSPLRFISRDRLTLTPHSIGSSRLSRGTGTKMAVTGILSALHGTVPDHVVNPEAVAAWTSRWGPQGP
jgi:D-3-phosphoglycerate dehydrogenase / 2-oxoglutarate reductase